MKNFTIYTCDFCGYQSSDFDHMRKHEAAHLGLTVEEMESYRALRSFAAHMKTMISIRNNERFNKKYDEAVKNVIAFEKEHGIQNDTIAKIKDIEKVFVRCNIGDKVRTKIHYENDSRREVEAVIYGVWLDDETNTIKYEIHFEPDELHKNQGSTGCRGYIKQDDILEIYQ